MVLVYNGFVNPIAMDAISWRYYIVFCCLLVVEFVVVFFTFPETFGFTLEETAQAFGDGALHSDTRVERKDADDVEVAHVDEGGAPRQQQQQQQGEKREPVTGK